MTMELKNPRYFRNLLDDKMDPAGMPHGFGDGTGRADASGPDESPRFQKRIPAREEIFFFDAEP